MTDWQLGFARGYCPALVVGLVLMTAIIILWTTKTEIVAWIKSFIGAKKGEEDR